MWIKTVIIGSGKRDDPYRADAPKGITGPMFAHIPTGKDGMPTETDCYLEVPDDADVKGEPVLAADEVWIDIEVRDPDIKTKTL